MQNKYRAELASSQSCFSIRRSLSRERILDWSIGKGPKIYLTELRDECHIWREEGSTFPHHHACFQENYVQIKSLSHHGHEDGDSSACRPPSIKCGRTIWLTHRARAVWSAPPVAIRMADSPTGREPPTAHEQWVLLHGGQGGTSLEYQTYTSAHPFDTIVAGLPVPQVSPAASNHLQGLRWLLRKLGYYHFDVPSDDVWHHDEDDLLSVTFWDCWILYEYFQPIQFTITMWKSFKSRSVMKTGLPMQCLSLDRFWFL